MPALLAHDYFGQDVVAHIGGVFFSRPDDEVLSAKLRDAFLLGSQGPDPLFFCLLSPHIIKLKTLGSLMHREKVDETIETFRHLSFAEPEPNRSLLYAYLLGFICHFVLDSAIHPFIYAQQYALCDAGVEGLDRSAGSEVHGQIEADLDAMMLRQRKNVDVSRFDYTDEVLRAGSDTLELLDKAYRTLAKEVYGVKLPRHAFSRGVQDMRTTIKALYSPRGIKRSLLGHAERIFREHSLTQAISLRADVAETCDFDNHEQTIWIHPFTYESSDASFSELYNAALKAAVDGLAHFVHGGAALDLTGGLNFEGERCRS